ncbi:50S ribosomal subunit protein L18 [Gammaproteobacteria bacterium]
MSRLTVHRTAQHVYAQIISGDGSRVFAAASTLEKEIRDRLQGATGNVKSAEMVGRAIADRAIRVGVTKVAFDRSGFKYHGRVKALADAARSAGLEF